MFQKFVSCLILGCFLIALSAFSNSYAEIDGTITKAPTEGKTRDDFLNKNNEFICDLNKGALGTLKVGDYKTIKDVVGVLGQQPDKIATGNTYCYSRGIIIYNSEKYPKPVIFSITLCYQEFYSPIYHFAFQKFNGTILPLSYNNENMQTIENKFGKPDEQTKGYFIYYNKPYGKLIFFFDENRELSSVEMSKLGLLDKSR